MTLKLTFRPQISQRHVPINVRGITAKLMAEDTTMAQIAELPVMCGNRSVEMAQLFQIEGEISGDRVLWEGDLSHVHYLGCGLKRGNWMVQGPVGNHVGAQMSGGRIEVQGDVGDYAGAEMRGGLLAIRGNAGDYTGGNYAGSKLGMNRGVIWVDGDVGRAAGNSMRRGVIAIAGRCQPGLATGMLGGTIVCLGDCQWPIGRRMKRGTVIATEFCDASRLAADAGFRSAGPSETIVFRLIAKSLNDSGFPVDATIVNRSLIQFAGDQKEGGRGEVFIAPP